jgi:uncharacterized protein (DUF305 family)
MNKIINTQTIIFLVIGFLAGFLVWGNKQTVEMHHSMDMDGAMESITMSLNGKTGDDFDKVFLAEMIVHHQGAVEMAKQALVSSKRPELVTLANDIINAQNNEINMMQNWQIAWFK